VIAFAADLHLCRYVWRSRRDLEGDSFRALEEMKKSLLEVQETCGDLKVVLGGDIFDSNKVDGSTLRAFTDFVDGLREQDVPVYFVQGNHDRDAREALAGIQGAIPLNGRIVELDGAKFYGLDWLPREELLAAVAAIPTCDFLVMHGAFQHLIPQVKEAADLSLDMLPLTVGNVLVGDIHVRDVSTFRGRGICVSPGALHPCNIEQGGAHGYTLIEAATGNYTEVDIPTRQIVRLTVTNDEELELAKAEASKAHVASVPGLETLVEIKYSREMSAVEEWPQAYPGVRFFLRSVATGKLFGSDDIAEAQKSFRELTLENSLGVLVDREAEIELYMFLNSLLTGDAQEEINRRSELCVQSA
jgi:DNA repair exonuclease SbcCD nuclease subunit